MNYTNKQNQQLRIILDECPQQPFIQPQGIIKHKIKKYSLRTNRSLFYYPKIIKHQNKSRTYKDSEHIRQWQSMQKRIKQCKSLTQRKKDKYDPIAYPPYIIRDISYMHPKTTKLQSNYRKYSKTNQNFTKQQQQPQLQSCKKNYEDSQFSNQSQLPYPIFLKKTNKLLLNTYQKFPNITIYSKAINLPLCNESQIIKHIISNNIYKQDDIKILYSRLCHNYDLSQVQVAWKTVNKWLKMGEIIKKQIGIQSFNKKQV